MGWVNHILGALDRLGQPHTGYARQAGSTTYWVHYTGWVNHITGTLDRLVQVNTTPSNYANFKFMYVKNMLFSEYNCI